MLVVLAGAVPTDHVITTGGYIVAALVTTFGGITIELIRRGNKASREAAEQAELAAKRSQPTSNGFAAATRSDLIQIKAALTAITRDVGGIREEMRTERTERIRLSGQVDRIDERTKDATAPDHP